MKGSNVFWGFSPLIGQEVLGIKPKVIFVSDINPFALKGLIFLYPFGTIDII